jgi:hypothetical protein
MSRAGRTATEAIEQIPEDGADVGGMFVKLGLGEHSGNRMHQGNELDLVIEGTGLTRNWEYWGWKTSPR